jgi:phosphatidylserine/phosphatidylglycerophosphate/cardiolipin synthase-like enzyme
MGFGYGNRLPRLRPFALAATLVLAGSLVGQPGGVTATAAVGDVTFTPTPGPVFTDPATDPEGPGARRIITLLDDLIVNSPAGSTIRIATMKLNVPSTVGALVSAHRRGVTVRIVLPERFRTDDGVRTLNRELNRRPTSPDDTSYVAFCHRACLANNEYSEAHSKLYLFSSSGTAQQVVVTSSSNITENGYRTAFNDAFTIVGNPAVYVGARRYVDRLHLDVTPRANPYTEASGKGAVMKFFPDFTRVARRDAVSTIFNNVHCRAGRGSGDGKGHTVVDLVQPEWSSNRSYIIDRLDRLQRRGCLVRVLTTRGGAAPSMLRKLVRSSIRVRYSDLFQGSTRTSYAHSKYIAINGGFYASSNTQTVFTGSTNMTLTATRSSDNAMLRIRDDVGVSSAYAANFSRIWAMGVRLTTGNADITAAQRRASIEQ